MSAIAIVIIVGMGIGWIVTDSEGKIGDMQVTSGGDSGSFFGKLILFFAFLFVIFALIILSAAP